MRSRLFAVLAAVLVLLGTAAEPSTAADDPLVPQQWALSAMHAPEAWAVTRGAGAVVAVVDTGVDLDHPDLASRVLPGRTFLSCGVGGCGNGDWESGPRPDLASIHGTHVAGIAAASSNGQGIAGVAPEASILPIKVLDDGGGISTDVALGVRWAADQGADVVNLSLGTGPVDQAEQHLALTTDIGQAVLYAYGRGVLVVAAAGNDALPLCERPAFEPYVLCVAATDKRQVRSTFSNAPVKPEQLAVTAPGGSDIAACGENVLSTVPLTVRPSCGYPPGYLELGGTSMSTPQVAGIAALLASRGYDRQTIVDSILSSARNPLTGERGVYSPVFGYGIVDAQAALLTPATAVTAPAPSDAIARLAGEDRIGTAIEVSRAGYTSRPAATVVLSRHDGFADALAGSPLAAALDGPVLLTPTGGLHERTEAEIRRVLPPGRTVHILGGPEALSEAVTRRLAGLGYGVVRYAGVDRFETATLIAEQGLGGPADVFLATGLSYQDALVSAPAAHGERAAVLLTAGSQPHPFTTAYLARRPSGRRFAVGSEASAAHPEAEAIRGDDSASTARMVAERFFPEPSSVLLATRETFPDALAGGAYAGLIRSPLLLVDRAALPPATRDYLRSRSGSLAGGAVLGGLAAVEETVRRDAESAIN